MSETIFAITSTAPRIELSDRTGSMPFTVHNRTSRFIRGRAKIVPEQEAAGAWLAIDGAEERDFPAGASHNFNVVATIPEGAEPGDYRFRLDAFDVGQPNDLYVEGPTVEFHVEKPVVVNGGGGIPWWVWAVAAAVLVLVLGGVVWALTRGVEVPELVDKPVADARGLLQEAMGEDSVVLVTADTLTARMEEDSVVLRQEPESGEKVKGGDTVRIWVGRAAAEMPPLRSMELGDATKELLSRGFDPDRITFRGRTVSTVRRPTVTGQTPAAHDTVPLTTAILVRYNAPEGSGGGGVTTFDSLLVIRPELRDVILRASPGGLAPTPPGGFTPQPGGGL